MAASVRPGAGGLLFLPYLTSAETPHWDAQARACFVGLSETQGLADMYRAVLEGLAYEERLTVQLIEKETGVRIDRIRAMGGAAQSTLFTQLLADVLERPIELCSEYETTALGAAVLAASAVANESPAETAKRMSGTRAVREPGADTAAYRIAFEAYERLYPALKGVFPLLSFIRRPTPI